MISLHALLCTTCQLIVSSISPTSLLHSSGSCIDGRLTSAWHWCSQLSSKPYFPLFKLTGFLSFDGQFDTWKFSLLKLLTLDTMLCDRLSLDITIQYTTLQSTVDTLDCHLHIFLRCTVCDKSFYPFHGLIFFWGHCDHDQRCALFFLTA